MKLSLNLLIFTLFVLFSTFQSVESKNTKNTYHKVIIKTKEVYITKNHKATNTVITKPTHKATNTVATKPTHKAIPGYDYVPAAKISTNDLHVIPLSENKTEQKVQNEETKKNEGKSSSTGTVTFVGLALVAVAAGGMSYRNKAKKQLESPELFRYKFENNTIYDCTPKSSSLTYSFNMDEFQEGQSHIDVYDIVQDTESEYSKRLNAILPTNRAYKAVLPWNARCVDEIQLNCGDLVCIKECYQDGYSLGRNLTTRFDGIFPTCCLDNIGSTINQEEVSKWRSIGMYTLPKRSDNPTKKAKRSSRGISLLSMPDWTKKLESLKLDSLTNANTIF